MKIWISQEAIECIGWTLVHFLWQGISIALMLAIVLRVLKHAPANARYLAECLALMMMVTAPALTFWHETTRCESQPVILEATAAAPVWTISTIQVGNSQRIVLGKRPGYSESAHKLAARTCSVKNRAIFQGQYRFHHFVKSNAHEC